jgi:hypothetical protein
MGKLVIKNIGGFLMISLKLEADEVNIILESLKHYLDTYKDGGIDAKSPEAEMVQGIMAKIQSEVG